MSYAVKELYFTLQGEGVNAGRAAVFLRFTGCNLWTGREADRASAVCQFCDTDFVGTDGVNGGSFQTADSLAQAAADLWPQPAADRRFIVCTGGEPLLQLDARLVEALHSQRFEIAVETNGTIEPPAGIDWLCVSPKAGAALAVAAGDELKLVFPQSDGAPERYEHLAFRHLLLQPMDGPDVERNTQQAIEYCRQHPRWRLSLQTHKILNLP